MAMVHEFSITACTLASASMIETFEESAHTQLRMGQKTSAYQSHQFGLQLSIYLMELCREASDFGSLPLSYLGAHWYLVSDRLA